MSERQGLVQTPVERFVPEGCARSLSSLAYSEQLAFNNLHSRFQIAFLAFMAVFFCPLTDLASTDSAEVILFFPVEHFKLKLAHF